jgi:high affinity Mn2+ porin
MQFRSLILAVMRYVNNRERRAAVSSGYGCGVSDQSPEPANLVRLVSSAGSVMLVLTSCLLASSLASAQNGTPAPRPEDETSAMQILADKGLHDIENESWNAYGQFTYISSWKPSFYAPYTNLNGSINSLLPTAERSFTGTVTLYLGLRLWKGAEAYLVPELISEQPLSQLRGLGGAIQNFELQKGGASVPQIYRSRLFLKQTIGLGGKSIV